MLQRNFAESSPSGKMQLSKYLINCFCGSA
jgi:hypothetical protein